MNYFTEAYYGKSDTLKEIESILDKMKHITISDYESFTTHPLNVKMEKLFEKQFGFNRVHIIWRYASIQNFGCHTLPTVDMVFRGKGSIINDGKGFYDKKHQHIAVIHMNAALFDDSDLTGSEVLGIILHEIGHNFDNSPYYLIRLMGSFLRSAFTIYGPKQFGGGSAELPVIPSLNNKFEIKMNDPEIVKLSAFQHIAHIVLQPIDNFIKPIVLKIIDEWLSEIPELWKLNQVFSQVWNIILRAANFVLVPVYAVMNIPRMILVSPVAHLLSVPERKGETWADSFATVYGYGAELARGLTKIDYLEFMGAKGVKIAMSNPITKILTDLSLTTSYILGVVSMSGATHGTTDTRIKGTIIGMKRELNNPSIPADVRAEIQNQINELEAVYDEYMKNGVHGHYLPITAFTKKMIATVCGGRSDLISRLFPEHSVFEKKKFFKKESYCEEIIDAFIMYESGTLNDEEFEMILKSLE